MPLPDLDPIHPIDMVVAAEMFAPLQRLYTHAPLEQQSVQEGFGFESLATGFQHPLTGAETQFPHVEGIEAPHALQSRCSLVGSNCGTERSG